MSSHFSYDNRFDRCGSRGHVFLFESGYRDQDEQVTEIWSEFRELAPEGWNACRQRGPIVCARCGKPATLGPRMHIVGSGPENASEDSCARQLTSRSFR